MTLNTDSPAVAACLSLWDEGLLAVASLHTVKAHRVDIRTCTYKSTNAMMLVSCNAPMPGLPCLCIVPEPLFWVQLAATMPGQQWLIP